MTLVRIENPVSQGSGIEGLVTDATVNAGRLSWSQRRFLALLGLPAFGIALAYTVVTTYLPVFIERLSGPAVTGILIGAEGIFSIVVPLVIGVWSDAVRTRLGQRLPFVVGGATLTVLALALLPVSSGSLPAISLALGLFFIGYFAYYSSYYALFPDLVPDAERGRSQGFAATFRSVGLLVALIGGGVLLSLWQPLPYLVGILAITAVTVVLFLGIWNRGVRNRPGGAHASAQIRWSGHWQLVRADRGIRRWVVANGLWEGALAALRVFVALYLIRGLGLSLAQVSGVLALVGVSAVAAAPLAGKAADRYGHRPVMLVALWVFGLGLLLPVFTADIAFVAVILPVAFAAAALLTLPYAVLMGLLPEREHHGAGASLFFASRGVGVLIGPLAAGFTVALLAPLDVLVFAETRGYAAIFVVASVALLASIPVFRHIHVDGRRPA